MTTESGQVHRFCPSCGTPAQEGYNYCGKCGQSLHNPATDTELQSQTNESAAAAVRYRCIDCRSEVRADQGARRCSRCNGPLVKVVEVGTESTTDAKPADHGDPSDIICLKCGTNFGPRYPFDECRSCGGVALRRDSAWHQQGIAAHNDERVTATEAFSEGRSRRSQTSQPTVSQRANQSGNRNKWTVIAVVTGALAIAAAIIFGVPQIRHDVLGNGSTEATFGVPCSQNPACSAAGSNGSNYSSGQLEQAYQAGYRFGQDTSSISFCRGTHYTDPQLNAQYQDGCGAGFSTVSQCANLQFSDPIAAENCRNAAKGSG